MIVATVSVQWHYVIVGVRGAPVSRCMCPQPHIVSPPRLLIVTQSFRLPVDVRWDRGGAWGRGFPQLAAICTARVARLPTQYSPQALHSKFSDTSLNRPRFQLQFYSHICMCITFLDWLDTLAVKRGNGFVFLAVISYVENLSAWGSCFCVLVLRIMFSARTESRLWECCTEKLPSHLQTGAVDQNKILDSCWESR